MGKYKIEIEETLVKVVTVEAKTPEQATALDISKALAVALQVIEKEF